ncbi:heterokaryon incompatibility protein-domain-containing protein, partial [Bisporella sp. PMI_857]
MSSALFESSHRLVSPRPENAECIDLARAWLDTCRSSHYRCAPSSYTSCPKRLLQVRGNLVYLREGNYDEPLPLFATLSYCWGVGKKLETTAETIEAHKRGIPITLLPRTIGDAVKVATWLGIQYIWVDALCIVQDSKDDWETECAKMGSYYNNSVLTISA